jgi:RimJ/RimL family protein N-acetyltransferase
MEAKKSDLIIKGESVYLRPITIEDTDLVVGWRNSKRVMQNFIYRTPLTREDHLNWMKEKVAKGHVIQFIICNNSDDKPLGSVYLQNIEMAHRKAEWGLFLGEDEAFGRGVGTQTGKLFLDYIFNTYHLHKIVSRVLARNKGCIHMCEKLGCTQEAYLKEELILDGKYEDLVWFGIINPNER